MAIYKKNKGKKNKNKRKKVSKTIWRSLEKLGYAYICNLQKNNQTLESVLTNESHDSGYDGIWLVMPNNSTHLQKILMEAKYRSDYEKSLPLSDCAKAIIIAFNMSANKLYIVTNKAFAPQTLSEINLFNRRSHLSVIGVNQTELRSFIQNNREDLINKFEIDKKFLKEMETDNSPKISIPDMTLYDNSERYFFDKRRKKLISEIAKKLMSERAAYMLTGQEGIGKSILGKEIEKELLKKGYDVFRIDLSLCTSSRILYLKILEAIWGVSLTTILEDEMLTTYLDQLITASSLTIEPSVMNAIKHILASGVSYAEHKDTYLYLLLKYIDCILEDKKDWFNLAIFFENINLISEEISDFLLELIKCLRKNNIKVLLEVRTPFIFVDNTNTEKSKWYFSNLKKYVDDYFDIEVLEEKTAIDMIQKQLQLSDRVCGNMAKTLGNNPLEIQSALKILTSDGGLLNAGFEQMSDEQLEEYWNECGISLNSVVPSLIRKLRNDPLLSYAFEMITLLKGSIPYYVLNEIDKQQKEHFIKAIKDSTLFKEERTAFECLHFRYLAAMEDSSVLSERYEVATWLLPIVRENKNANPLNSYIELNLLYALGMDELIPGYTLSVITLLKEYHQYKDAIKVANRYIDLQNTKKDKIAENKKILIDILLQAISCIKELDEDNNPIYDSLYEKAYEYIILDNDGTETMGKNWYQFHLLMWFKEFKVGHFDVAFDIAKSLYDQVEKVSKLFHEEEDYPGQVYNSYGLSVKVKNSGDAAEKIFRECVSRYPKSYFGRAALLSQIGNRLLRTEPLSAAQSYTALLKIVKGKDYPYQECLHTRIDIAMSNFLGKKYNVAYTYCKECVDIASTIGIYTQKGRALNIWGCCLAAEGDYKKSEYLFRESHYLLALSKAVNYSWRAQMNLASILLQQKKIQDATAEFEIIINILINSFREKIAQDQDSVPYQCLLVVLLYFKEAQNTKRIKQLLNELNLDILNKDFSRLSKLEHWRETFHSKVVFRGNVILVTG